MNCYEKKSRNKEENEMDCLRGPSGISAVTILNLEMIKPSKGYIGEIKTVRANRVCERDKCGKFQQFCKEF